MDLLSLGRLTLIFAIFFFPKRLSSYYICCIYSNTFQTTASSRLTEVTVIYVFEQVPGALIPVQPRKAGNRSDMTENFWLDKQCGPRSDIDQGLPCWQFGSNIL